MTPTVKNYMRLGQPASAQLVNFGASPLDPPPLDEQGRPYGGPLNRRAELWLKSRQWLEDAAGVQIPDSDALQVDACGPAYRYDALTRLSLERSEIRDHFRKLPINHPRMLLRSSRSKDRPTSAVLPTAARKRTSREVRVGPEPDIRRA